MHFYFASVSLVFFFKLCLLLVRGFIKASYQRATVAYKTSCRHLFSLRAALVFGFRLTAHFRALPLTLLVASYDIETPVLVHCLFRVLRRLTEVCFMLHISNCLQSFGQNDLKSYFVTKKSIPVGQYLIIIIEGSRNTSTLRSESFTVTKNIIHLGANNSAVRTAEAGSVDRYLYGARPHARLPRHSQRRSLNAWRHW